VTKGQDLCLKLIDKAIDEDCKWKNFVLVGTKKDLLLPETGTQQTQQDAWEDWRDDMVGAINQQWWRTH
jgi:hypothetical protein